MGKARKPVVPPTLVTHPYITLVASDQNLFAFLDDGPVVDTGVHFCLPAATAHRFDLRKGIR